MGNDLDFNFCSSKRLANISREAVNWPESNFNDLENEEVYHSTTETNALRILDDEVYNPMKDDFIDSLKVYALRDIDAVDYGEIDLSEYLIENEEELLEHGPKRVQEGLKKEDAEHWSELLNAYGFTEMDVRTRFIGPRRTESLHVGDDREFTKTQSNYGSDVTFELLIPENSRHDSDIPGEVPFSYTTAIYVNDEAGDPEKLSQEIEQTLNGTKYEHVNVEKNF